MLMRPIANPRRTTLAHLKDADEQAPQPPALPEASTEPLPARTANPRRTVLNELPRQAQPRD
ncbi:conserved protein of unknown function [Streptantibioticus cattleyicolor NRRL 8057 = DSM 46488]|nr:hypothetical protein [Streptomyces sp. SID5468]CCB77072.1 conserved protein of unknown function [Streptantibioticus cattleyicolor NRRL 8057 = DSM 46488]